LQGKGLRDVEDLISNYRRQFHELLGRIGAELAQSGVDSTSFGTPDRLVPTGPAASHGTGPDRYNGQLERLLDELGGLRLPADGHLSREWREFLDSLLVGRGEEEMRQSDGQGTE